MNLNEQIQRINYVIRLTESVSEIKSILRRGSKGYEVELLQKLLGIYTDGKFGPQTKKCLQEFQRNEPNVIEDDGIVGPDTKRKLEQLESGKISWTTPEYCKTKQYVSSDDNSEKTTESYGDISGNIVIGDSISPWVAMNTAKADLISNSQGPQSLWKSGVAVSWLIKNLKNYPISNNIKNVIISIGTNGLFSKNDNISGLISLLKTTFPNAKLLVVQGSYGWGALKNIEPWMVTDYYSRFKELGVTVIEPPVGNVEPHGNRPVYKKIGAEIDRLI
jgi:hypothetical protein